ncbi:MAG: DUF6062 family protein, partial [Lachnospiraceae bacterium]|nr:DUF6062 family protein [Lachnospiraceae bacterium]
MKEHIHTIPLTDAFQENDECPFCFLERKLEEHTIDFVLGPGASYMEDDIRAQTDAAGFCRMHYKKLYDYGNRLGMGLILKTHFKKLNEELREQIQGYTPSHTSLMSRFKKIKAGPDTSAKPGLASWAASREDSCYICNFYQKTFARYMDTFFEQFKKDTAFRETFAGSKGLCVPHFGDLVQAAETLPDSDKKAFMDVLLPLMQSNMERLYEELDWFCDKFDYRNRDADWKNSRDAIQRGMQKAAGGYPALPPHTA